MCVRIHSVNERYCCPSVFCRPYLESRITIMLHCSSQCIINSRVHRRRIRTRTTFRIRTITKANPPSLFRKYRIVSAAQEKENMYICVRVSLQKMRSPSPFPCRATPSTSPSVASHPSIVRCNSSRPSFHPVFSLPNPPLEFNTVNTVITS